MIKSFIFSTKSHLSSPISFYIARLPVYHLRSVFFHLFNCENQLFRLLFDFLKPTFFLISSRPVSGTVQFRSTWLSVRWRPVCVGDLRPANRLNKSLLENWISRSRKMNFCETRNLNFEIKIVLKQNLAAILFVFSLQSSVAAVQNTCPTRSTSAKIRFTGSRTSNPSSGVCSRRRPCR